MTASTILTMANGKGVDLLNVRAEDLDLFTLAEHLAKEKRFNGATPGTEYSVAQHLCIGCDAMMRDGATDLEAGYFLAHDFPEGLFKDDPTPKKRAIAHRISERCGVTAEAVLGVLKAIDVEHEAAVHEAAGLPYPVPDGIERLVKLYDRRMLVTEWRDLMRGIEFPVMREYDGIAPLPDQIKPWRWNLAFTEIGKRMARLFPKLRRAP